MNSHGIRVPKAEAEEVRRELIARGVFNSECRVMKENEDVIFPVIEEQKDLPYPQGTYDFPERKHELSYPSLVKIPEELREFLPSSFDTIGDVGIVKIPEELADYTKEICGAIREANHLRAVAADTGVTGEFRIRAVRPCAGDENLETTHREFGIKLLLDPSKVYFSPRLAGERWRVASLVKKGEKICDMFAGVGPFGIMIAKHSEPEVIHAFDINPAAVEYMERNIEINRLEERIMIPHLEDSAIGMEGLGKFDRIIMNLPHSAHDFLGAAHRHIADGGTIHYYEILETERLEERLDELKGLAGVRQVEYREVKTYSPTMRFYGFDVEF